MIRASLSISNVSFSSVILLFNPPLHPENRQNNTAPASLNQIKMVDDLQNKTLSPGQQGWKLVTQLEARHGKTND